MPDPSPREPWPGYGAMSPAARMNMFKVKEDEARRRWDQAYAIALSAAVANYEQLRKLQEHPEHDGDAHDAAGGLHDDAKSWQPN